MEDSPAGMVVRAEVPWLNVWVCDRCRSMTQGRATYTMQFEKYAHAPASVAEAIIEKKKGLIMSTSSKTLKFV